MWLIGCPAVLCHPIPHAGGRGQQNKKKFALSFQQKCKSCPQQKMSPGRAAKQPTLVTNITLHYNELPKACVPLQIIPINKVAFPLDTQLIKKCDLMLHAE